MSAATHNANSQYLDDLAHELRLLKVTKTEREHALFSVHEAINEGGVLAENEFGPAKDYVRSLYPENTPRQFFLFTLTGMIVAALGFVGLHVFFESTGADSVTRLWKFTPILLIPLGMAIDVTRFKNA